MHRKQKKKQKTKKQKTRKQKTNKQKQSNENFQNLWTQGPLISPWLIQLCKGVWVGLYPGGLISFEMSHSTVDRNTFLIYQFLINL